MAFLAVNADGVSVATIRSTLRRAKLAASSGKSSTPLFSEKRYSIVMFFPSIHPSLLSSWRNAVKRIVLPAAVLLSRKPTRKSFQATARWPAVSQLLWKKRKAYSLGIPKTTGSWSESDRGGTRPWEKVYKDWGQWKDYLGRIG